ncbi:MAG: hypothetical protein IT355_00840 [Gemmatimonadaceae bacterium]|nr:hypothetical protein [Gemmatimonadaceae bacterium]
MKEHQEILRLLNFGADVAENDAGLDDYFVETSDFSTVLAGTVDVIRGHKGLGKTAMYRTLLSGRYTPPRTLIVSASEATASDVFRATKAAATTEDQFRLLWTAYLASVIANEVLANVQEHSENKAQLREIADFLKATGLAKEPSKQGLMDSIRRMRSVGFGLGMTPDGLPTLNFSLDLSEKVDKLLLSEEHVLRLVDICIGVLRAGRTKLWVLIDRLDELFQKSSANEIHSLRALLRAHLNICALRQGQTDIRCKIFIRTDIYDRVTKVAGFTNVTHLRDLNIVWNARSIVALVSRRMTASLAVRQKLNLLKVDTSDPNQVWNALSPATIQTERSHVWIAKATMDGTGAFNPRNYITLLSLATRKNIELQRTNPSGVPTDTILSADSIVSSFGELSRKRLDDTVLAEFPSARPYLDRLRGGTAAFDSIPHLADALGLAPSGSSEVEAAIELLVEAGVLRRITFSTFSITYLYRPALKASTRERSNRTAIDG